MLSRKVVFFDDLSEEELERSGITISTLAKVGKIATVPNGFILSSSVFEEFRSQKGELSQRLLPWSVELDIAKAFDRLGSDVVHILPSPSYPSEISGSYLSDKTSIVTEIRKTMMEFLSEEEEDFRKGKEVEAFRLAFLVQEIPPHSGSGSIERGANEGQYDIRALFGLPVDLSSSDRITIDMDGSVIDRRILSQEKKWIAGEAGIEEVEVEEEARRELKIPGELIKKLSALGDRLTSKIGMGTFFWYLKNRVFIVWNVGPAEEKPKPKEEVVSVEREIPPRETSIFLLSTSSPEDIDRAEIQGLFLLPLEDAQPSPDELLTVSERLRPRPFIILAGEKGMESLARAREEGGRNIWPMFAATTSEFQGITKPATDRGLKRSEELPFWLMVGSPTTLLLLREMAEAFDGLFIPLEDIMSRMEESPQDKGFDLALSAIAGIIEEIHKRGLVLAIGTSTHEWLKDLSEYCVDKGIDILAVEDRLIEDVLSLWRAKET